MSSLKSTLVIAEELCKTFHIAEDDRERIRKLINTQIVLSYHKQGLARNARALCSKYNKRNELDRVEEWDRIVSVQMQTYSILMQYDEMFLLKLLFKAKIFCHKRVHSSTGEKLCSSILISLVNKGGEIPDEITYESFLQDMKPFVANIMKKIGEPLLRMIESHLFDENLVRCSASELSAAFVQNLEHSHRHQDSPQPSISGIPEAELPNDNETQLLQSLFQRRVCSPSPKTDVDAESDSQDVDETKLHQIPMRDRPQLTTVEETCVDDEDETQLQHRSSESPRPSTNVIAETRLQDEDETQVEHSPHFPRQDDLSLMEETNGEVSPEVPLQDNRTPQEKRNKEFKSLEMPPPPQNSLIGTTSVTPPLPSRRSRDSAIVSSSSKDESSASTKKKKIIGPPDDGVSLTWSSEDELEFKEGEGMFTRNGTNRKAHSDAALIKHRRFWTSREEEFLCKGVDRYGEGKWARILKHYDFNNRSSVDLKDKWRNLKKKGLV